MGIAEFFAAVSNELVSIFSWFKLYLYDKIKRYTGEVFLRRL